MSPAAGIRYGTHHHVAGNAGGYADSMFSLKPEVEIAGTPTLYVYAQAGSDSDMGLTVKRSDAPPYRKPFADWNTLSNIGSVSLPVNVFCWLGWYEAMKVRLSNV